MKVTYSKSIKTRSSLRQPQAGFTLLEIMIALAIIGITLTVIVHTVNFHTDVMYENTLTTSMYQLAKEKMYELETAPVNSKGKIEKTKFTFENTALTSEESDIVELKTVIRGYDMEVVLNKLVLKKEEF